MVVFQAEIGLAQPVAPSTAANITDVVLKR
jgi:hypothetical protein